MKKLIVLLLLGFITSCTTQNTQTNADFSAKRGLVPIWQVATAGRVDEFTKTEPVYHKGLVYTADTRGFITGINQKNGNEVIEIDVNKKISSGPAVNDKVIIVATADASVMGFDRRHGNFLWEKPVSNEVLAMPVIHDDIALIKSSDGVLYAINPVSGQTVWTYKHGAPSLVLRGGSRPAISGNTVVVGFDDGKAVALNLDQGQLLWQAIIKRPMGSSPLERMVDIDADPVINDGVVYIANYQGNLSALSLTTGDKLWSHELSSYSGLAVDNESVFITDTSDVLWAFDKNTGSVLWKQASIGEKKISSPSLIGNNVVVGDQRGNIYRFSALDGSLIEKQHLAESGVVGSVKVVDDHLLVFTQDGGLRSVRLLS